MDQPLKKKLRANTTFCANTCAEAITTFGPQHQMRQTQEECAELILAISHFLRDRATPEKVIEEIADVEIMCAQMRLIFNPMLVETAKVEKLKRLKTLLSS